MDIIETSEGSRTGYLAVRPMEYADCIANILYNTDEENETIRNAARLVFMGLQPVNIVINSLFSISNQSI